MDAWWLRFDINRVSDIHVCTYLSPSSSSLISTRFDPLICVVTQILGMHFWFQDYMFHTNHGVRIFLGLREAIGLSYPKFNLILQQFTCETHTWRTICSKKNTKTRWTWNMVIFCIFNFLKSEKNQKLFFYKEIQGSMIIIIFMWPPHLVWAGPWKNPNHLNFRSMPKFLVSYETIVDEENVLTKRVVHVLGSRENNLCWWWNIVG